MGDIRFVPKSQPGPTSLSVQLIRQVLESALEPTLSLVMIALAWHASDRNGRMVWPSIERLAWLTKLSRSTVKRALDLLGDGIPVRGRRPAVPGLHVIRRVQTGCGRGARLGFDLVPEYLPSRPVWAPGSVFRDGKGAHAEPLPIGGHDPVTGDVEGAHRDQEGAHHDPQKKIQEKEIFSEVVVQEEEPPSLRAGAFSPSEKEERGKKAEPAAVLEVVRNLKAMTLPPMKRGSR